MNFLFTPFIANWIIIIVGIKFPLHVSVSVCTCVYMCVCVCVRVCVRVLRVSMCIVHTVEVCAV